MRYLSSSQKGNDKKTNKCLGIKETDEPKWRILSRRVNPRDISTLVVQSDTRRQE